MCMYLAVIHESVNQLIANIIVFLLKYGLHKMCFAYIGAPDKISCIMIKSGLQKTKLPKKKFLERKCCGGF